MVEQNYFLAREGKFEQAQKLINSGIKKFGLTKNEASDILITCGDDVRYWFIKPLMDIGGEIPIETIEFARRVLKNGKEYDVWNSIPGAIKAYKFIIKVTDEESYSDLFKKFKQFGDNESSHIFQDYIYRKFIRDISDKKFKNIDEASRIAKYIEKYVISEDVGRWYA